MRTWITYYEWYGIAGGASFPLIVSAKNRVGAERKTKSLAKAMNFCVTDCGLHGFSETTPLARNFNPWLKADPKH